MCIVLARPKATSVIVRVDRDQAPYKYYYQGLEKLENLVPQQKAIQIPI